MYENMPESNIASKLNRLVRDFNNINDGSPGDDYSFRLRGLILLSHLYIEHIIELLMVQEGWTENEVETLGNFYKKIKKLRYERNQILDEDLFEELKLLNKVRGKIAHKLNIFGELSGIDINYLDIRSVKFKTIELIGKN